MNNKEMRFIVCFAMVRVSPLNQAIKAPVGKQTIQFFPLLPPTTKINNLKYAYTAINVRLSK